MTILEDTIDLDTPSGAMRTHLFQPSAPGRWPGLVLFSEIFQITGAMRRTAAIFASHGYVVAAPEIYHEYEAPGTVLDYKEGSARGNDLKTVKPLQNFEDDISAVLRYLGSRDDAAGGLGAVGFCIGGHLALRTAMRPEVGAAICFYATDIHKRGLGARDANGNGDDTLDRLGEVHGEALFCYGRRDPHIPAEGRRILYDALAAANVNFTWHEWDAEHAFMRDEGPRYNPAYTRICYDLALEVLERRLKGNAK